MIISTFSKKRKSSKPKKIGRLRKIVLGSTKSGLATRIGLAGTAVGGIALTRRLRSGKPIPTKVSDITSQPLYKASKEAANQATQGAVDGGIEGIKASTNKIVLQPLKQTYTKVRQIGYGLEARVRAIGRKTGAIYGKARARGRQAEAKVMTVYQKLRAVGRQYEQKVMQQYRKVRAIGKKVEHKVLNSHKQR